LITAGVAERWLAKQMGHTSIAMLEKHYGRWVDAEMPNMVADVSKTFQNRPTATQIKII
jgi:integrase